MKRYLLLCALGFSLFGQAQRITLNDSVIFSDNKPYALYISFPNSFSALPNTDIFNLDGSYAVETVLLEFPALVRELKPFFYYEIRFPVTGDTLSVIYDGTDFTRHLAEQVVGFRLLPGSDESENRAAVENFRNQYTGVHSYQEKIKETKNFLNYTRNFDLQAVRDRTKPVSLVNNRVIMQDGVIIGIINLAKDLSQTNMALQSPVSRPRATGRGSFSTISTTDYETRVKTESEISYPGGLPLQRAAIGRISDHYTNINNPKEIGYQLFSISRKKKYKSGEGEDFLIRYLCFLVEDYRL